LDKEILRQFSSHRQNKPYDHLEDVYTNAGSVTECTGLISHAPLTEEEYESFRDIYDFSPPDLSNDRAEDDGIAYGSLRTAD